MKILLVSEIPLFPSSGGVQRHVFNLAKFHKKMGNTVDILTAKSSLNDPKEAFLDGVKIIKEIEPVGYKQFSWINDAYGVMKKIRAHAADYDIIHYHGGSHYFFRFLGINQPLVATLHGIYPVCLRESYLFDECKPVNPARCALCYTAYKPKSAFLLPQIFAFNFFHRKFITNGLNHEKKIICVSDYVRKCVSQIIKLNNLVTIPNFIDYQSDIEPYLQFARSCDIRESYGISHNAKILVYFGRISSEKGVDILLEAFQKIVKLDSQVHLFIGGNGPQRQDIVEKAQEIPNAHVLGFLSREDQIALMYQSDMFVSPSRFADACPTTLIEAAALGLPVVATDVGGSPEIVLDKETGLLVEPQNPCALSAGILQLLSQKGMMINFKRNAVQRAKLFDINAVGPRILSIYREVLSKCSI